LYRARDENLFLVPEKLITQRIGGGFNPLVVGYDNKQYYTFNSTNSLIPKDNSDLSLKFICVLLNSKLLNWYYRTQFSNSSTLTVNISKTFLEQLPIKEADSDQQRIIVELFEKVFSLVEGNGHMHELQNEIDQNVYRLYNLTPEEILIIESSSK
jgi:restriction endonuclease S subunit